MVLVVGPRGAEAEKEAAPWCLAVQVERAAYRAGDLLRARVSVSTMVGEDAAWAASSTREAGSAPAPRPCCVLLPQECRCVNGLDFALQQVASMSVQFVGKRKFLRAARRALPGIESLSTSSSLPLPATAALRRLDAR